TVGVEEQALAVATAQAGLQVAAGGVKRQARSERTGVLQGESRLLGRPDRAREPEQAVFGRDGSFREAPDFDAEGQVGDPQPAVNHPVVGGIGEYRPEMVEARLIQGAGSARGQWS